MTTDPKLNRILKHPKATRRDFMVGATSLGFTVAAASAMWSGRALASQPKRGGHLRAGVDGANTGDILDPTNFGDTHVICVSRAIRDSLVEVGQDGSAQPALAESWEPSADATTWVFNLRKGVKFSNGKSLTTDDVIASINAHRGEETKSGAKGLLAGIDNIRADGPDKVVFELNSGNSDFPYLMTDFHLYVLPSEDGKALLNSTDGTGCYKLEEFDPGVKATMSRNPNAWQSEFGFVDSAELLVIQDVNARQSSLFAEVVDVINRPDLKTAKITRRKPGINLVATNSTRHFAMEMNTSIAPFSDNNVRMALKHLINRQEFVDKILYGFGNIGNDQPIGPGFRFHADDIAQNTFDIDKAKFYLREAGLSTLDITYHAADVAYPGAVDWGQLYQETARKAGVNLELVREPDDGYWYNVWSKVPFHAGHWGARPVEDMLLSLAYVSGVPWNVTRINIPQLDEVIKLARFELDEAKRFELYREAQVLISSQGGTLIPAFAQDVMALSDRVKTTSQYGGGWEMDGGFFVKRWWMA